ncbi:TauD/TfdA family dioxygenase [Streptomyces sp. NPDC005125]
MSVTNLSMRPGRPAHRSVPVPGIGKENVLRLSDGEVEELWLRLGDLAHEIERNGPDADLVETLTGVVHALPTSMLRAVHRFRTKGSRHDALLLRNLIPDGTLLEPTPREPSRLRSTIGLPDLCVLSLLGLLGEPFTFSSLHGGRLVQDVVPVRGQEQAQTSMGSGAFLDWHVEDAFTEDRCDYVGLFCVRGAPDAVTVLSAVRNITLDAKYVEVLRRPRFVVRPDAGHDDLDAELAPAAVISGSPTDPEVCYDAVYTEPYDPADRLAASALEQLKAALTSGAVEHRLEPGELLVVDNRRVVHARTSFSAHFDGTDRWLKRVMVCSSLPRHRRRGGSRSIAAGDGNIGTTFGVTS